MAMGDQCRHTRSAREIMIDGKKNMLAGLPIWDNYYTNNPIILQMQKKEGCSEGRTRISAD